ncbi:MAG: HNH endonuclease [Bacteriovoracaceae bacterium]|nr:HNH endonuclease [Bacteriovoracaceae bacterium]
MNKICFTCQKVIKDIQEASIEHIVPKSLGGTFRLRNLALSHKECNKIRGAIICRIVWELKLQKVSAKKMLKKAWPEKMSLRYQDIIARR